MFRLTRAQTLPIGLDLGHDSVKLLQLEVLGSGGKGTSSLAVAAAARQSLPAEARREPGLRLTAWVELVRQMLRQPGFSGRRVVAGLPPELVQIKNLRLPPMPLGELESAVQLEARNLFGFEGEQARIHAVPAGEVRQGNDLLQEVLVLAARHEDVDNFLEQLHRCGLEVASLEASPLALFRSAERFIRRREDEQEVQVLVDVGLGGTQVVIGRGREISFIKRIEIGGRRLNEAAAAKLGLEVEEAQNLRRRLGETAEEAGKSDPIRQAVFDATRGTLEELGREIALCLRYYSVTFRGQRPGRVRLLGGEACLPQVSAVLAGALTIPVEAGRPLYSVDTSRMAASERRGPQADWAVALGLSLRYATGRFAPRDGRPRGEGQDRELMAGEAVETKEALHA